MNLAPVSDFQDKEVIATAKIPQRGVALQIDVLRSLPERRIFVYLEVKQSVDAAYILGANVEAWYNTRLVGKFPVNIGDLSGLTPNQSIGSLLNAGGSPVGDSYVHRLAQPFNSSITSVVLQPLRINAEIDELRLNFTTLFHTTVTGFRAYLACLSTKY